MAIGWCAALLLHGGLLTALILERPAPLPPQPGAAVTLLVQRQARPEAGGGAVAPRPPQAPARLPEAAKPMIADAAPRPAAHVSRKVASRVALAPRSPAALAPTSAPALASPRPPSPTSNDAQGFVSAAPVAGDFNQPPAYPDAAVAHDEQGSVLLSIHILPDGTTDLVSVTGSSGYDVLDQAAQAAVMKWRFKPARMAGRPVVMVIPFIINFDLSTRRVGLGG